MTNLIESMISGDLILWSTSVFLEAGARGILLLGAVLVGAAAMRRASAAARHRLVGAGFLAALLLPVGTLLPWELPILPARMNGDVAGVARDRLPVEAPSDVAAVREDAGAGASAVSVTANETRADLVPAAMTDPSPFRAAVERVGIPEGRAGALRWAAAVWLLGFILIALRMLGGEWRAQRLLRRAKPVNDEKWTNLLWESADRLDVGEDVRLLRVDGIDIPFTMGAIRAAIVLPESADGWAEERRRAVLLHELAHIRRRDILLHHASRWACALYWFNPLAWIAASRLRAESERAADDLVLNAGTSASDYADHLLQIVSAIRRVAMPSPVLPLARRREFEGRLIAILEPHHRRSEPTMRQTVGLTVAIALLALPLAALSPMTTPDLEAQLPDAVHRPADAPDPQSAPHPRPDADPAPATDKALMGLGADTPVMRGIAAGFEALQQVVEEETERTLIEIQDRLAIVEVLAEADEDPRVIQALIRILQTDSQAEVRLAAARGLAELEAVEAVDALGTALRNDEDPRVRAHAAWALGEIEDERAIDALSAAVEDGDPEVREAALGALAEFDSPLAAAGFASALADPDPRARRRAAIVLADLDLLRAPPELVGALADTDPDVRVAAAWALGEIEDPTTAGALGVALADSVEEVRHAALHALLELDSAESIDVLIGALDSPDPDVRRRVAEALGDL